MRLSVFSSTLRMLLCIWETLLQEGLWIPETSAASNSCLLLISAWSQKTNLFALCVTPYFFHSRMIFGLDHFTLFISETNLLFTHTAYSIK